MEKKKRIPVFGRKREGKSHLEDLGAGGKIILKSSRGQRHYLDAPGSGKEPVTGLINTIMGIWVPVRKGNGHWGSIT